MSSFSNNPAGHRPGGAPFCSFIVPVYNTAAYLSRCVDSILAQSCGDFELLLVDDGSTDGSGEVCDAYARKDSRVRVLHQPNGGHTAARNAGLARASGGYIAFVDSDDWIDPDLVADCCLRVQTHEADILWYGYRLVREGRAAEKTQPYPPGFYGREDIVKAVLPTALTGGRFSLCERFIRRELAASCQAAVSPGILLGEDLLCCVRAAAYARSLWVLPGCYYNYFQRRDSVTHTYRNYTFENWLLVRAGLCAQVGDILPDFRAQLGCCSIRFLHRAVLGELTRSGAGPKALRRVRKTLGRAPFPADLKAAAVPPGKRAARFKRFCLRRRLVLVLWLADRIRSFL